MVPEGSDSRSDFTRVVGTTDVMVQAIIFLASADRLEESMEVRAVMSYHCCHSNRHQVGRAVLPFHVAENENTRLAVSCNPGPYIYP